MLALALVLGVLAQPAPGGVEGEWPVEVSLPDDWRQDKPIYLLGRKDPIPGQVIGRTAVFLVPNVEGNLTMENFGDKPYNVRAECIDDGKRLLIKVDGRNVLQYNHATVEQPDPVFSRSGYIHPIWTPAGRILTNDSPPNHLHHHGLWSAWTSSEFEGRKTNFWESKEKQGRIEHVAIEGTYSGPVCAGFKVKLRYLSLTGPAPKSALEEIWEVRAYALTDRTLFDLTSTQSCATDQPLLIKEYRYGGIGFRGSADWEGRNGAGFLTSEGRTRSDGHATKVKWVAATGKIDGAGASIGFLAHPTDFRFPPPVRIHPDEPFFNWAVPQGGDFSIEPGKPYVSRYRFLVVDGALTSDSMSAAWSAYGERLKPDIVWLSFVGNKKK